MADAAARTVLTTRANAGRDSFPITDGVTLYEGQLISLVAGYANHWDDDEAGLDLFLGIALRGDDRLGNGVLTGETSDPMPPEVVVDTSGVILMHLDSVAGTPTAAKVGDLVYSVDSDIASISMTDTTGDGIAIGVLWRFRSANDVDVKLFTPTEWKARVDGIGLPVA